LSRARVRRVAGAHIPRADRAHGRRRAARPTRGRVSRGHDVHPLLLATRARPAAASQRPRDRARRPTCAKLGAAQARIPPVATLLADPPAAASSERQPAPGPSGEPQAPTPEATAPVQRTCAKCDAPMDSTQDWCLSCGAGDPDSLSTRSPSWRSAAAILAAVAILVAGAATAAYAALSKGSGKAQPATTTVARGSAPVTCTPGAPVTPTTPPPSATAPPQVGTPTTVKPVLPLGAVKPPKIPLTAPTPQSTGTSTPPAPSPTTSAPPTAPTTGGANSSGESQETILLDTNAAVTYNPYAYPAGNFGDPSLAIDGDTSTGWTALVDPAVAPKMAEGLVIDLNTAQKL